MDAKKLYSRLNKTFKLDKYGEYEWNIVYNKFINENFRKRRNGVLLDNTKEIKYVFTAVFPSDEVLTKILKSRKHDVLLVTHHPMVWDIRKAPNVFTNINPKLLPKLKERRISIYTLHVPLDKNGKYSTTVNLAKALGIIQEGEFLKYFGVKVGVIGRTKLKTSEQLEDKLASVVEHKTKLWKYGRTGIENGKVALGAGGGNEVSVLQEVVRLKINTYITGITALNDYSRKAHEFAKENKINIIGGTHYSTEKFACISLCDYFENIGIPCEFIEDKPILEDLE